MVTERQPGNARVSERAVVKASRRSFPAPGLQGNVSIKVSISDLNAECVGWEDAGNCQWSDLG